MMSEEFEFEEVWDWWYLAKYFDLEVSDEEVEEYYTKVDEMGLIRHTKSDIDQFSLWKIGVPMLIVKNDIKDKLLIHKLRKFIHNNIMKNRKWDSEEAQAIRSFVRQLSNQGHTMSCIFWEHLLEIDEDYVFFDYLCKNLESLWD